MQTAKRLATASALRPVDTATTWPRELPPSTGPGPHRVARIGLGSVAKLSLFVYLVIGLALVTAAVALAVAGEAMGITGNIDRFARNVLDIKSPTLRPLAVGEAAGGLAAAVTVVAVLLKVLGAFVYNRIADLTGGIGVHLPTPAPSTGQSGTGTLVPAGL